MQFTVREDEDYHTINAWMQVFNDEGEAIASTLVEFYGPYDPNRWVNDEFKIEGFDKEFIKTLDCPLGHVEHFVEQFNDEFHEYQSLGFSHLKKYENELG